MSEATPTGRWRLTSRRHWGNDTLVLQLEVTFIQTSFCGGVIDAEWVKRWRDARTSDLTPGLLQALPSA